MKQSNHPVSAKPFILNQLSALKTFINCIIEYYDLT